MCVILRMSTSLRFADEFSSLKYGPVEGFSNTCRRIGFSR